MRNATLLLLCTLLLSHYSFSQKHYLAGIVTLSSGDSLHGYIEYKNWERTPRRINFKKNPDATVQTFDVRELHGFAINGADKYKRAVVWMDKQTTLNSHQYQASSFQHDTILLRSVVEADKLSLYEFTDNKTHFFIQAQSDTIQELYYREVFDESSSKYLIRPIFQDQLKKYAFGHPEQKKLFERIEALQYREKHLKSIVTQIVGNSKVLYTISDNNVETKELFLGGGIEFHSMNYSSESSRTSNSQYTFKGILATAGMDIYSKRRFQNLFVRAEIQIGTAGYKGTRDQTTFWGQKESISLNSKLVFVRPTFSALYQFLRTKDAGFYGGISVNYTFQKNTRHEIVITNHSTGISEVQPNYGFRWTGGIGGSYLNLGWMYKKRVEVRAVKNIGGFLRPQNSSKVTGVLINYRLH